MNIWSLIPHRQGNKAILRKIDDLMEKVTQISYSLTDVGSAPKLNPKQYFNIPYDGYLEIGHRIMCRRIRHIYELEEFPGLSDLPKDLSPERDVVLVCLFGKDSFLSPHYHDFEEEICILSGKAHIFMDSTEPESGKVFIPKYLVHQFSPVTEGVALVTIKNIQ